MNKWQSVEAQQGLNRVGLVLVLVCGAISINNYLDVRLLARTSRVTTGTVVDTSCSNHGHIDYAYSVNSTPYQGTGVAPACGLTGCSRTLVGEVVRVTYSSANPGLAICARLENEQINATNSIIAIAVFAVGLGFGFYRYLRS